MPAGRFDRTVALQRQTVATDGFGGEAGVWPTFATVPAGKLDVSDSERLANAQVGAFVTTRFQIRWSPEVSGLTAKDRLVCEGVTYAIAGVKETGRRRELLEITASRQG